MCYSEERGGIGSSQHIFDIKCPKIFYYYYSSVFADVFNIFKIFLCSFVSCSTIFHGFGSYWHYSKPRWAFHTKGFCYKFKMLNSLKFAIFFRQTIVKYKRLIKLNGKEQAHIY